MASSARSTSKKPRAKAPPKKTRASRPTHVVRLERGEEATRVFWEVSRAGTTLTTRFGRWLQPGRTSTRTYGDKAEAEAALEAAVAKKRAEGFADPAPKEVIGGSSSRGVSARNPELEALIAEDPSDLSRYLIYADWLQQERDPRGELIVVQHKLATAPEDASAKDLEALDHIEWKLLRDFGRELLGPLARFSLIRRGPSSARAFAWRCGFVRAARWQGRDRAKTDALRAVLSHPSMCLLEQLVIDGYSLSDKVSTIAELAAPTLKTVIVDGHSFYGQVPLKALAPLERLRRIVVTGIVEVNASELSFSHLEELSLGYVPPEILARLPLMRAPALRRLELVLGGLDRQGELKSALEALFKAFPSLAEVRFRQWQTEGQQDRVAEAIVSAVLAEAPRLVKLGLEIHLTRRPEALMALLRELPRQLTVEIPEAAIGDAYARRDITAAARGVIFTGAPDDRDVVSVDSLHHARA